MMRWRRGEELLGEIRICKKVEKEYNGAVDTEYGSRQ
jgi:hypothetical protein